MGFLDQFIVSVNENKINRFALVLSFVIHPSIFIDPGRPVAHSDLHCPWQPEAWKLQRTWAHYPSASPDVPLT